MNRLSYYTMITNLLGFKRFRKIQLLFLNVQDYMKSYETLLNFIINVQIKSGAILTIERVWCILDTRVFCDLLFEL